MRAGQVSKAGMPALRIADQVRIHRVMRTVRHCPRGPFFCYVPGTSTVVYALSGRKGLTAGTCNKGMGWALLLPHHTLFPSSPPSTHWRVVDLFPGRGANRMCLLQSQEGRVASCGYSTRCDRCNHTSVAAVVLRNLTWPTRCRLFDAAILRQLGLL